MTLQLLLQTGFSIVRTQTARRGNRFQLFVRKMFVTQKQNEVQARPLWKCCYAPLPNHLVPSMSRCGVHWRAVSRMTSVESECIAVQLPSKLQKRWVLAPTPSGRTFTWAQKRVA